MTLRSMPKCSVTRGSIEENNECKPRNCRKTYFCGGIFPTQMIVCLGKKISPYFPFHNVGRSASARQFSTLIVTDNIVHTQTLFRSCIVQWQQVGTKQSNGRITSSAHNSFSTARTFPNDTSQQSATVHYCIQSQHVLIMCIICPQQINAVRRWASTKHKALFLKHLQNIWSWLSQSNFTLHM